jgi:putative membrane protein
MYHYYWGMYSLWWIFWIVIWILFFLFLISGRRTWATHRPLETPMQILQRRYAAGEITNEEYEERRAKLLRDANTKDA